MHEQYSKRKKLKIATTKFCEDYKSGINRSKVPDEMM